MSVMDYFRNRNVPRLTGPDDLDEITEQFRVDLTQHLRNDPSLRRNEFAPQPDYSIERAEAFLSSHLDEIVIARATLAVEVAAAEEHLAELKRRVGVTTIVHDALAETLTKLAGRAAAAQTGRAEAPLTATEREETEAA